MGRSFFIAIRLEVSASALVQNLEVQKKGLIVLQGTCVAETSSTLWPLRHSLHTSKATGPFW